MKVLLINPSWVVSNKKNLWRKVASCYPSLGLGYIAAVLEKDGHKVKYLDMTAQEIAINDFLNAIEEGRVSEYDYIGLTATTPLISNSLKIAEAIKKKYPKTKIVLGGVHPTVQFNEIIEREYIDFIARGEGEITMKEIVAGKSPQHILGISYKTKTGKIVHNKDRPLIENLDDLPIPAYHLMPIDKYHPPVGGYKQLPGMSIFATRGCPGRCNFCYRVFPGCIRFRSAERIVEEIVYLHKNYGIKEINFYDDTFTAIKPNAKKFCELLIKKNLGITWSCFTRVNYVDEELFRLMKKAGCHLVLFGVESGDQKILDRMNKMINLDQIRAAVKICKKVGIDTRASYIFGAFDDTIESMEKTLNFALELDTDTAQFNIMTAYPGTALWKEAEEKGWLDVEGYDYNMSDASLKLPTVSNKDVQRMYRRAHMKFYLRPKLILRRLKKIESLLDIKQELQGFMAIISQ